MPATTSPTGLAEAERQIKEVRDCIEHEKSSHAAAIRALEAKLDDAKCRRDLVLEGLTLDVVAVAESMLEVRGREKAGVGDGPDVLRKAIDDLAAGAPRLRRDYLGTKNYDRWTGQAVDCAYGHAPSHGSIIFSIGLAEPYRGRANPRPLSEAQLDAAIAYLHAILRGARR